MVQLPVQDELWQAVRSWTPAWQLEFGDLVDYLTPPSPQAAGPGLDLDTGDHDADILCTSGTGRWYRCSGFCDADLLLCQRHHPRLLV